jgi:anti-anti-sigma factor
MPPSPVPILVTPPEITLENLPGLEREVATLVGPAGKALAVDLGKTLFMSSSALGLFVKTGKMLRERGGAIGLARPQPVIQRLLMAVGLDGVLPAFPTVAEAQAHAGRGAPPAGK